MRKVISFSLMCSAFLTHCKDETNAKYFSGTIEYVYTYSSDSLDQDSISAVRPAKGFFRYDTANYQSQFIGADTVTYYYSGSLNKGISEKGSTGVLECEEYGTITDSVLSTKLYDSGEQVLGYRCKILELQKTRSVVRYYFSKEMIMGPSTYRHHRAYNWDIYGEKAEGGLVLKLEHRFKNFIMYGIATVVKRENNEFKALEIQEQAFAVACKN